MSNRAHASVQARQKALTASLPSDRLLQHTYFRGGSPEVDEQHAECQDKRLALQSSRKGFETPSVSAASQGNTPARGHVTPSSAVVDRASHFGHDFSRIPVYPSRPPV